MNADKDDSWAHQYLADREYEYCLGKDRRKFEGETSLFEKEKDDPEANKECALTRKKWASALVQFSSVQLLTCVWLFVTPWTTAFQASLTNSRSSPKPMASSWWCHPTITSSVVPFSCPHLSQYQGLFQWVSASHEVAEVLEFQLQLQSFQWTPRTDFL